MTRGTATVLGLGRMGSAIARRLAMRGWEVLGWSRTRRPSGIRIVGDPVKAVAEADVVVLALFDAEACLDVLRQVAASLRPQAAVVNVSTVGPDEAEQLAEACGVIDYVHAPVIGSRGAAEDGALTVLAAGPSNGSVESVLTDLGRVLTFADIRTAATAKLLANGVLADSVLALRDGLSRGSDAGVPMMLEVLEAGPLAGLVRGKRELLLGHDERSDFSVGALAKDMHLLADVAPDAMRLVREFDNALDGEAVTADADIAALCRTSSSRALEHGTTIASAVRAPNAALEPLLAYIRGHATGDPAHFRSAFLPSAHIEGMREGRFVSWSVAEYCAIFNGRPATDEPDRRRHIENLEIGDGIATATMRLEHGAQVFTDMFLLVQADDRWQIANKLYVRHASVQPRAT